MAVLKLGLACAYAANLASAATISFGGHSGRRSGLTSLHEQRLVAAHASGGISNSEIHLAALKAARSIKPAARRILDFGSGVGDFIAPLHLAYPQAAVAGADILERPPSIPSTAEWFQGDLNNALPIPDGAFDLICAIEVIEHLENLRFVLREIFRLLEPGGAAILTTPNTGSIRSLLTLVMRGHYALFDDYNYPAHITAVTTLDFSRAGTEAGFQAPQFFYTGVGSIPKLLTVKWQRIPIAGPFLKGRLFSDNFGAVFVKRAGASDGVPASK